MHICINAFVKNVWSEILHSKDICQKIIFVIQAEIVLIKHDMDVEIKDNSKSAVYVSSFCPFVNEIRHLFTMTEVYFKFGYFD